MLMLFVQDWCRLEVAAMVCRLARVAVLDALQVAEVISDIGSELKGRHAIEGLLFESRHVFVTPL